MKSKLPWIILVLAALVFVITHFTWLPGLPERLATHFDGAGKANGWMTKSQHGAFMLLFGLGVPALFLVLCWSLRYFSPTLVNLPNPQYWRAPENFPMACEIMFQWAQWEAAATLIWMTFLNLLMVQANQSSPPHLSSAGIWTLAGFFLAFTVGSIVWLLLRFKRTTAPLTSP